jgi:hypothetical protein
MYAEATEMSPIGGGDDRAQGFPFTAQCCIPLQCPLLYVNQPKAIVASKGYNYRFFYAFNS